MKKLSLIILNLIFFLIPTQLLAIERTVQISWSTTNTINIQGFKMYYDYQSDMNNKQLACSTTTAPQTTTRMTCYSVSIDSFPVYFSIAAIMPAGYDEILSPP